MSGITNIYDCDHMKDCLEGKKPWYEVFMENGLSMCLCKSCYCHLCGFEKIGFGYLPIKFEIDKIVITVKHEGYKKELIK